MDGKGKVEFAMLEPFLTPTATYIKTLDIGKVVSVTETEFGCIVRTVEGNQTIDNHSRTPYSNLMEQIAICQSCSE